VPRADPPVFLYALPVTTAPARTRSPIKSRPRRGAGTGLRNQIIDLAFDVMYPAMLATTLLILAGYDWLRWFFATPPVPIIYTILAILAWLWAWRSYRRTMAQVNRLALALDGERTVADLLADLADAGYRAFHDLEFPAANGGTFNVDHILIGPAGIFAIETKTRSKRDEPGSNPKVVYNGETVLIDGHPPERDPIAQARASADAIRHMIKDQTGRHIKVRGVVLYPGWYIKESPDADVWVLEPKRLRAYLRHTPPLGPTLSRDDVAFYAAAVERYQRSVSV
jgi:hypothetical protein